MTGGFLIESFSRKKGCLTNFRPKNVWPCVYFGTARNSIIFIRFYSAHFHVVSELYYLYRLVAEVRMLPLHTNTTKEYSAHK